MNTNIVIGVGGTGAKVVESILHLSVAGLVSDNLQVGLVDQDGSNGNAMRTEQLITRLVDLRSHWRRSGAPHSLGASALFRTEIRPVSDKDNVWTPHPRSNMTLGQIFDREGMPEDEKRLFDSLFAIGTGEHDTEQNMALDRGYRGRPHVGSAAMTSRIEDDIPFWKRLLDALESSKGSTEVRILLAGSVFGGTGAAGFPTLAKLIRRRLPAGADNVRIGGILMLPYFDFDPPDTTGADAQTLAANVARSEELAQQAKSALKHYADMMDSDPIFDQLYMVGWDRTFHVGAHHDGANLQNNPALPPELIAGMAAGRFFLEAEDEADTAKKTDDRGVFALARSQRGRLSWDDLPSPFDKRPKAPMEDLGRLLRFAVAWKYWSPIVSAPRSTWGRLVKRDPWYVLQGVDQIDFKNAAPEAEVKALNEYVDELLRWAAAMELRSQDIRLKFDLWDLNEVVTTNPQNPQDFSLPPVLAEAVHDRLFETLIVPNAEAERPPGTASVLAHLNQTSIDDPGRRGMGVFVGALHQFVDLYIDRERAMP